MTIKNISIENIKGISNKRFDLGIIPNKPSLLVAPNGFGKSSITAAFSSLSQSKLKLEKHFSHRNNDQHKPKLIIEIEKADGSLVTLTADENNSNILGELDVFVINSRLEANASKKNMGGFTTASASLEIGDVVLVEKIPENVSFGYSVSNSRTAFGVNGKILPNIVDIFTNVMTADSLLNCTDAMKKIAGDRIKRKLDSLIARINSENGSAETIIAWIEANAEAELEGITPLAEIANVITPYAPAAWRRVSHLLAAYQIAMLYLQNEKNFKKSCIYNAYLEEKKNYSEVIESFDTTWLHVKPKETKGKLVVEFPKALHISNGQRDSLCFAASLQRAQRKISKSDCILIIDEVFDYLDDANLTAAQYYVSKFIEKVKGSGRRIYPLILTHLNPAYFKNYAFGDQKVYFLDKRQAEINEHLKKIINKRETPTVKNGIDRHHFHFSPTDIDLRNEFKAIGLKETWGKSDLFHQFINAEYEKYKNNDPKYDPFAVCCAVRIGIESLIYRKIADPGMQQTFLDTHGTKKKLRYAESIGIFVPDTFYLLGVIYNEGMHIKENMDNASPIAAKLENLVIRKLVDSIMSST